ncbi:integrase arm-type DNA-binding domain-containing protein [Paraburkholderia sp.]|uniref:tyrosine-type recombinase/integrase n=1 Tax=Paraburkholderia sp. TaxID=1926495 RepID=UPI0025E727BA|nr:integrase arm-type DNA-binding domain-containing protein [Paraburkholderia sp.]
MGKSSGLSDMRCRQARHDPSGGNKLFDGGGLYLALMPSGAKKWRLKYRFNGKENLLTFGDYPSVTLAEARERRERAKRLLTDGIDPALQRDIDRQTASLAANMTFRTLADEWLNIKRPGWSAGHDKRVTAILKNDLYPHIGKLPITGITGPAILATIRKIEARGAHEIAVKALEICSGTFRHACACGATDRDATIGLRAALAPRPPVKHYPHVTETELPTLLERIDGYSGNPETKIALKLIILTFLRTTELRWARWDEFDLEAKEWRVPAERMKGNKAQKASGIPHIVPLADQTLELLEELRQFTGRYPLLFPGTKNHFTQAISAETINKALKILGFEGRQTGHGFRDLASTIMNDRSGINPDVIERQLAHTIGSPVRRAYNHAQYMAERHRLMQWWADYIDQKSSISTTTSAHQHAAETESAP